MIKYKQWEILVLILFCSCSQKKDTFELVQSNFTFTKRNGDIFLDLNKRGLSNLDVLPESKRKIITQNYENIVLLRKILDSLKHKESYLLEERDRLNKKYLTTNYEAYPCSTKECLKITQEIQLNRKKILEIQLQIHQIKYTNDSVIKQYKVTIIDNLHEALDSINYIKVNTSKTKNLFNNPERYNIEDIVGTIGYSIADNMKVGDNYIVNVILNADEDTSRTQITIAKYSQDSDKIEIDTLRLGEIMSAELIDPSKNEDKAFVIKMLGSEKQKIDLKKGNFTFWQWNVIPQKEGVFPLYFSLQITERYQGQELKKTMPIFNKSINVTTKKSYITYILAGTLLFMSAVFLVKIRRRKRINLSKIEDIDKKTISEFIAKGQLDKVFIYLNEKQKKGGYYMSKELQILYAQYNEIKKKELLNLISTDELMREKSKINYALLELIEY